MVKKAEVKKRQNPLLPVLGLFLAAAFAAVAYGIAPFIVEFIKEQVDFQQRQQIIQNQTNLEYAFAVFLWLILFGSSMMLVATAIGEDPDREDTLVRPRDNASEREWRRYEKRLADIKAKRLKRVEQVAKAQAKAEKRERK